MPINDRIVLRCRTHIILSQNFKYFLLETSYFLSRKIWFFEPNETLNLSDCDSIKVVYCDTPDNMYIRNNWLPSFSTFLLELEHLQHLNKNIHSFSMKRLQLNVTSNITSLLFLWRGEMPRKICNDIFETNWPRG